MKNAQSPITTLGIPASSSTAKDNGPRRKPSRASPARRRRWRLEATSGAGITRSAAVPRLMTRSGRSRDTEERATRRGNGLECNDVVVHYVGRQLGIVRVAAVLLAVGDQPVEHVD